MYGPSGSTGQLAALAAPSNFVGPSTHAFRETMLGDVCRLSRLRLAFLVAIPLDYEAGQFVYASALSGLIFLSVFSILVPVRCTFGRWPNKGC
jgi:hypothetical protein